MHSNTCEEKRTFGQPPSDYFITNGCIDNKPHSTYLRGIRKYNLFSRPNDRYEHGTECTRVARLPAF